jgi:hypothetical protein
MATVVVYIRMSDCSSEVYFVPFYSILRYIYQLMESFFWCGNRQDHHIYRDQLHNKITIMTPVMMSIILIFSIGFTSQSFVLAQISFTNTKHVLVLADNNANNFAASFHPVVTNIGQPPMITNISSNGNYKVQLSFNSPLSIHSLPKSGFSPSITFLNGTAPPATSNTIPNRAAQAGVTTIGGSGTQYNVPGSIQRLASVSSFDMTIYDNHGKVLWNKANQPVTGGKGLEQVVLPNGYTGNISILIHNIKPGLDNPHKVSDTVKFSAKVG